jgi:hypothetical protein
MGSFGHAGHMPNQSNSSGGSFMPIVPETQPENRPHFFQSNIQAKNKPQVRYAESRKAGGIIHDENKPEHSTDAVFRLT